MVHSLFDRLALRLVQSIAFICQRVPLRAALSVGWCLGWIGYFFAPKRRRVAYANLKSAFPESTVRQRKQWTQKMFCHLGMNGAEVLRSPQLTKQEVERWITNQGYETYLEERWKNKGLILLTAHLGNWELSQIVEAVRKRPVTVLARKQNFKRLDGFLNRLRQHHGSVSLPKNGIRDLIRGLREGNTVGILADQSGGDDGIWVRFFGRLTTAPRGPIALALKWGFTVIPVFMVRRRGSFHDLIFEPPFELIRTGDYEKDLQVNTQNYIRILESYIHRYPTQWLWGHKRWKRTRTKRIVILSDGKPGHVKQSESVVKEMVESGRRLEPPCEMPIETIEVQFRSERHRKMFPIFAFFFIPWAQGRLAWLRFFLSPASSERIEKVTPDLIISAGASVVPLNLCLARENLAKSIVLMKPSFPFNLFRYDLAIVPSHDRGWMPGGHFEIEGSLSSVKEEDLTSAGNTLAGSLPHPEKIGFGIFLGGGTRDFKFSLSDVESLLTQVDRAAKSAGKDFLITTSRRTADGVSQLLEKKLASHPRCQLLCVATKDKRREVVPGMMALADILIVTEDSLSMISEALSSGKKVVVVKMAKEGLASKHYRFQETLRTKWKVPVVEAGKLFEILAQTEISIPLEHWRGEREKIREKVGSLL